MKPAIAKSATSLGWLALLLLLLLASPGVRFQATPDAPASATHHSTR